jgi:hypothetical protein
MERVLLMPGNLTQVADPRRLTQMQQFVPHLGWFGYYADFFLAAFTLAHRAR